MPGGSGTFSKKLLENPEAANAAALERIAIAKSRILAVLDRETAAHRRTLEQKIAAQGPEDRRVDPHLIGLAIMDMIELNRLKRLDHPETGTKSWFSNIGTADVRVQEKLAEVAPLYAAVSGGDFGNQTGDALEVVTFQCLKKMAQDNPRYAYQGHFYLERPKQNGRFQRIEPPQNVGGGATKKKPDFIQYGYDQGPICIECKNYREWLYPRDTIIKELIVKSYELECLPLIIDRRIHYTTRANLLVPAGIMAHESYFQYYPSDKADLASKVAHKRLLGFTDVRATEEPDKRTMRFFETHVPKIVSTMAKRWKDNRQALYDYANGEIHLAQLYNAIGSPAGGKWADLVPEEPPPSWV